MPDQRLPPLRFTLEDQHRAWDVWGSNCGPAAIAAVSGMTLDELRPHLGDFEAKRYTNPTLMWSILDRIRHLATPAFQWRLEQSTRFPQFGLARVQWEGPWTAPGVPARVAYRHTHWIGHAATPDGNRVFDVNAMSVGGWLAREEWADRLVPWLLAEIEPKASGYWRLTHVVEIDRA